MARDLMNYKEMIERSLKNVVRESLTRVAEKGLPGNHHFYVSFRTHFPGVLIPDHLRKSHPDEMTIVLQNQFWGLTVSEESFEITLSFHGNHELLSIPFAAVTGFVDPSVEFGLQFEVAGEERDEEEGAEPSPAGQLPLQRTTRTPEKANLDEEEADGGEEEKVVVLDKFRKD